MSCGTILGISGADATLLLLLLLLLLLFLTAKKNRHTDQQIGYLLSDVI